MNQIQLVPFFILIICLQFSSISASYPSCDCRAKQMPRIVGGQLVQDTVYPWIVSLGEMPNRRYLRLFADPKFNQIKKETHFCNGVVITPNTILTAAHCLLENDSNPIRFRQPEQIGVGIALGQNLSEIFNHRVPAAELYVHPNYIRSIVTKNEANKGFDIGIIKFREPLPTINGISPSSACLSGDAGPFRSVLQAVGHGLTTRQIRPYSEDEFLPEITKAIHEFGQLKSLNVIQLQPEKNRFLVDHLTGRLLNVKHDKEIFVRAAKTEKKPSGMCSGDSGSGLHQSKFGLTRIVGIASTVTIRDDGNAEIICDDLASYTNVAKHLNWIQSVANDHLCILQ